MVEDGWEDGGSCLGTETRNPDGGEGCGPKVEAEMLTTEAFGKERKQELSSE